MVKININTPLAHSQRDIVIKAFKSIGWKYERIIQSGEYSLFRFFGSLPADNRNSNVDVIVGDDVDIDIFKQLLVREVEIFILFERS